jgi:hypothetical protein
VQTGVRPIIVADTGAREDELSLHAAASFIEHKNPNAGLHRRSAEYTREQSLEEINFNGSRSRSRRGGHRPTYQRVKRSYHDGKPAHLWLTIESILRRHFDPRRSCPEQASDSGD